MALYSDKVMDHFQNPRNVGKMDDADGVGEVGNAKCGDIMKMYIKVKDGIITDVKFNTFGCGSAIATSSMATELIKGKRMLIVDDVISTGESLRAMEELVTRAGGIVAGRMAVLAEGDAQKRHDIICLAPLPLFNPDGTVKE